MNPIMYEVFRTTTDKLGETLNRDINWTMDGSELVRLQYVGGRDWVIVVRCGR